MPRGGRFVHHRFVAAVFSGYIMFTRGSVVRRCAFFAPTADLLRCLTPIRLVHDRLQALDPTLGADAIDRLDPLEPIRADARQTYCSAQRQCNVAVLPAGLASAYDQFMVG